MQAGRPALIQKDGGEMLIAMVLDRPLAEAKSLWRIHSLPSGNDQDAVRETKPSTYYADAPNSKSWSPTSCRKHDK